MKSGIQIALALLLWIAVASQAYAGRAEIPGAPACMDQSGISDPAGLDLALFLPEPQAASWVCVLCTNDSACVGVCPNGKNGGCILQRGPTCGEPNFRACFCN